MPSGTMAEHCAPGRARWSLSEICLPRHLHPNRENSRPSTQVIHLAGGTVIRGLIHSHRRGEDDGRANPNVCTWQSADGRIVNICNGTRLL
jgi:hypothetical protein